MTKRLLFLALLLSTPLFAQGVGCRGVPGAIGQIPKNGCGGVPGAGGGTKGLPEQWLMHDGAGQSFADTTPNDNTITTTDITWGTGTGVTSPTLNGTTSTGVAEQVPITNFDGTKPFSVSIWINTATIPAEETLAGTIASPGSNFQGWGFAIEPSGAMAVFLINDFPNNFLEVESASTPIPANTPTNLIFTYDGSQSATGIKCYVGGVLTASEVVNDDLTSSTASGLPLYVGSRTGLNEFFGGSMSNLQILPGILTSAQIAAIQTAGP